MLIVNITTISSRLDLCAATLFSLVLQSKKPDKIIVWVSKDKYLSDDGINNVPEWLDKLNIFADIIEFKFTRNTGPYRKIMPILMECNDNDILVYADDDVIYGREWLSELYSHFCEFSGEYVVASRIRKMRRNIFGHLRSYNDFPLVADSEILYKDFIITGVGGCMLSRKHILSKFVFTDDYLSLAPKADDIWLSISMQLSGAKVLPCLKAYSQVQQIEHDNFALSSFNTLFKRNTKWNALISKVRNKVLGYLGYSLTMNDKTLKLVISSLKNK